MKLSSFNLVEPTEDIRDDAALIESFNRTRRDYPRDRTVAELFSEQAAAHPDAIALSLDGQSMTYGELERRANRLAHYLSDHIGLREGALIAFGLERSFDLIVTMLGILKAGGAYLPLDLAYPAERLRFMLEHSGAEALITRADLCANLPEAGARLIQLDWDGPAIKQAPDTPAISTGAGGNLAYVMYTSGSTGRPKAVAVPQRAITRLVRGAEYADFGPDQVFLQYAPVSFDAATFEIWGPLLNGARLALAAGGKQSLADLGSLISREGVTTLWLTGGLFNAMLDTYPESLKPLRQLLAGGEALSVAHVRKALDMLPGCRLVNGYGPTENTTFSCCYQIAPGDYRNAIPIGAPIANSTAYILDDRMRLLPPGTAGELYVGGDGLAIGYWNDPALTAERFVANPFASGERLYRTGDLACWRGDGSIDFLGRLDDQIKIRGFRIEPGEIEAALHLYPGITGAVAQAWSLAGRHDRRTLITHYTAEDAIDESALREHLEATLPDFMVPTHLIRLDSLPLNPNGKIDRAALPPPPMDADSAPEPPSGETETALAEIWSDLLGTSPVGATDDFFMLGGHSLLAAKMVATMEKRFGVTLPLTSVLTHPTIRELAGVILDAARFGTAEIDQPCVRLSKRPGEKPLFALPPGTTDALSYGRLAGDLENVDFHAFNFIEAETRIGEYADLITGADPDGPHILFGYSGGGNLAFQVALELERRGRRVSDIVMLDASRFLKHFDYPEEEADRLARTVLEADGAASIVSSSVLRDKLHRRIRRYYAFLSSTTETRPVTANIHLICSPAGEDEYRDDDGTLIASKQAWAEVTRGAFHRHEGHGDHGAMLLEPYYRANAALLGAILTSARAPATASATP
ncbi:amino acid adenylation domain-containing protein [uncultured Nisaea sp.]|uniref:non-ribosomal peptide synthetase n=1 Tax=uncultured Nisaea sp. TaxID=538215 RepID=UPI0030EDC060|tara:strand:- start:689 stop:3286 length:2598 start_codon:yes stop_codon:yes gene_type:complete